MATHISITELREALRSPDDIRRRGFPLLKAVAAVVNDNEDSDLAREMVLRALDHRDDFGVLNVILDGLAREVGLFPYVDTASLGLSDMVAYEYHRPLNMEDELVFHREQAHIYRRLLAGDSVILSAPTSFGKSKIIDAMIALGRYKNIAVIVPTLALIDETRRRLAVFSDRYKVVTHLSQAPAERNVFVLTAERAVAYEKLPKIDFFVIDEFYKIGAQVEDGTRTVALNQAFYRLLKGRGQFYLLGPNIQKIPEGLENAFRCVFYPTTYATVVAEQVDFRGNDDPVQRLVRLAKKLEEPTLIFCSSPSKVNAIARALLDGGIGDDVPALQGCADWAGIQYHPEWIFAKALTRGIGIHHGKLPRSLAQYTVRAFNDGRLRFLICTSTLIEGVNTKAKNVIIFDNTIARREIDHFTFNNIKGRSGRMFQHFIGRVYVFNDPPDPVLPFVDFPLFTQSASTPDSLLIQMESPDLSTASKDRMKRFSDQNVLPLSLLRQNGSIEPADQIALAEALGRSANDSWPLLAWNGFPNWKQLRFVCGLIWTYLVKQQKKAGVFSGDQLAFKASSLYRERASSAGRVRNELKPGKYSAKSPDEAVERVLDFDRSWAGFDLPRYLMAVSSIQAHVLAQRTLPIGDYAAYSAQVECLFKTPIIAALDEYGIPVQIAEKLQAALMTTDDLDTALLRLKRLDLQSARLTSFEREIVSDAQLGL
ncbi:MAG: helicase [Planctomycetes bacterium]|nr:helicase [Planctomycetota bacterium]